MSDIQAGDLVMVVHSSHACTDGVLGRIYTVEAIGPEQWFMCPRCIKYSIVFDKLARLTVDTGLPLSWLRKINPPAVQQTTEEEITA